MESVCTEKQLCCGCGACCAVCPVGAVEMKPDVGGFVYPSIDRGKCIDCRNCLVVCPTSQERESQEKAPSAFYVARLRNGRARMPSFPGAVFTAIANAFLGRGGVVCKTDFDAAFRTTRRRISWQKASEDCPSATHEIYRAVVEKLREGRTVLFGGAPCQIAGLRGLMRVKVYPSNLYTCDVTCHFVRSPTLWAALRRLPEREDSVSSAGTLFRSQAETWTTVRHSCPACLFAGPRRASDISIADYTERPPELCGTGGLSLVMTNSTKGTTLWDAVKSDMMFYERPFGVPSAENIESAEDFWSKYRENGLDGSGLFGCFPWVG